MFIELHDHDSGEAFTRNIDTIGEVFIANGVTWLSIIGVPDARPVRELYADLKKALVVTQVVNPVEVPAV